MEEITMTTEIDTKAEKAFTDARSLMAVTQPFFAVILLGMGVRQDRSFPTMYTIDGEQLGYNPDFFLGLSEKQRLTALAHEVLHPALLHNFRCGNRDPELWNVAGDFAENPLLADSGFDVPDNWLMDAEFDGMSAEQIYTILLKERPPPQSGGDGGNESQAGGPNGDSPSDHISHGNWKHGDQDGCGFMHGPKSGSRGDKGKELAAATTMKARVAGAAMIAKQAGKLPASLERYIQTILEAKIPWTSHLLDLAQQCAKNDFNWTKPNRRYLSSGFYLPSISNMEMGKIVITMDTSGSMDQKDLENSAAEVSGILNQLNPEELIVIYTDADVSHVQTFTPDDFPIKLEARGGGGTSFVPSFEWVERNDINPACHIYMTDMYCNEFAPEPDYPVFWCVVSSNKKTIAPYGQMLYTLD
jgi:predicted metal-dependent peptidase